MYFYKIQVCLEREHRLCVRSRVVALHPHGYDQYQGQAKARRHRRVQLQIQHRSKIDSRIKRRSNRH